GSSFHVSNPMYASINSTMKNFQDYSAVDLETLPGSTVPVTEYKPLYVTYRAENGEQIEDTDGYDSAYGWWQAGTGIEGDPVRQVRVRENYRVMWRAMAATTGERTLV